MWYTDDSTHTHFWRIPESCRGHSSFSLGMRGNRVTTNGDDQLSHWVRTAKCELNWTCTTHYNHSGIKSKKHLIDIVIFYLPRQNYHQRSVSVEGGHGCHRAVCEIPNFWRVGYRSKIRVLNLDIAISMSLVVVFFSNRRELLNAFRG